MKKRLDREAIKREKLLVADCLNGKKEAWGEFVDTYKGLIYNTIFKTFNCVGYKNTEEVAEDLFQDVFTLLFRDRRAKLRSFKWKNDCSLVYWLGVVTKNLTFDYLEKRFSREKILTFLARDPAEEGAVVKSCVPLDTELLTKIQKEERSDLFEKALAKLSEKEFYMVELVYFRELPFKQVAFLMGKSIDAVYSLNARVVRKLKRIIERRSRRGHP